MTSGLPKPLQGQGQKAHTKLATKCSAVTPKVHTPDAQRLNCERFLKRPQLPSNQPSSRLHPAHHGAVLKAPRKNSIDPFVCASIQSPAQHTESHTPKNTNQFCKALEIYWAVGQFK